MTSTWETFLRAHAAVLPLLQAELERAGQISLNRYDVLVNLSQAGGALRLNQLVSRLVLSQPSVSRLVDALAHDGLVSREREERDRRGTLVRMTADGERALQRAQSVHELGVWEHFTKHLTPEEAETVGRALTKVLMAASADAGQTTSTAPPAAVIP